LVYKTIKIMKKNIYYGISTVCLVILLAGCSKTYLDTKPTDAASPETVFETTGNAALAINGLAKMMTIQYLESQGFNGEGTIKMYYGNYPGTDFYFNLPSWAPIINSTFHENTTSIYLYYPWYYYYKIIGNANTIIKIISTAQGSEEERQLIKAQALCFRAYSYMMLLQLYGNRWSDSQNGTTKAVVLRLDQSTDDLARSTLKECYDQIYKDLEEAIPILENQNQLREKNFEIDKNVAYAIYARTALNRQDYSKAETFAKKARTGYPIMNNSEYSNGFSNPTSEWIWSSYGASDETLYFYSFQSYIAYNSTASAVRIYPKCINKLLFATIPDSDIRKKLFLNPQGFAYNANTGLASAALSSQARTLFPDIQSNATIYAFMQFKFKANDLPGVGNLVHFRSSEMLLIEAEAKYFQNKPASEIQNVLIELNKTSGRDPDYTTTKTGEDLLNEIKLYRRIELWGEGFDWFDQKRWGNTITRTSTAEGGSYPAALAVTIKPEDGNKWTWAIPNREFDYNTLINEQ